MIHQWIKLDSYISKGITGKGAVVAVIDFGFDVLHGELSGRFVGARESPYTTEGSPNEMADALDHGTPVASIIAGRTCGIAPDARLLLLKASTSSGTSLGAGSVARAINYAIDWRGSSGERVSIINLSFGGSVRWVDMRNAIRRAVDNNILVICAAGNDGDGNPSTDEWAYPAGWPEVISVGSHDSRFEPLKNSNTNLEIDLIAPGEQVRAASKGGGYRNFRGTSAAAPCVAGAAALIYEFLAHRFGRPPTELELRHELLSNTTLDGIDSITDPRAVGVGRLYLGGKGDDDMTRAEFIQTVAPVAVKVRVDGGVLFPSVSIAQTILETGGKIHSWNNIVGYKVGSGRHTPYWHGKSVNRKTWEVYDGVRHDNVSADFRAYDSIEDCLKDQALLFINNRARYQRVIEARTPEEQANMLQACGYATDPQYASKIIAIIRSHRLDLYDEEAEKAMERLAALEERLGKLEKELANEQKEIPAPSWFVDEFGSEDLDGLIEDPDGLKAPGTWEAIAIAARLHGLGKGKRGVNG